ncbi:hypothetical protein HT031_003938 [Scenedesmus sp. PABB004]|nr:hypothetical protein HT031_003938 [Scenedesmus sp. PABB004]
MRRVAPLPPPPRLSHDAAVQPMRALRWQCARSLRPPVGAQRRRAPPRACSAASTAPPGSAGSSSSPGSSPSSSPGSSPAVSWLQRLERGDGAPPPAASGPSIVTRILSQSDALQRAFSSAASVGSDDGSDAGSSPDRADGPSSSGSSWGPGPPRARAPSDAAVAAAAAAVRAALHGQRVALPRGFAVPAATTVPAYQLVGVLRAHLGCPTLPQAARCSSVEAKWGVLRLAAAAARGRGELAAEVDALLDRVLLPVAARKLAKVLANPAVPAANKQGARERHDALRARCAAALTAWAVAAAAGPAFAALGPALEAVGAAMAASLATGAAAGAAAATSAAGSQCSGRVMEAAALASLRRALPRGWALLPSLHLLGVDGAAFEGVQPGCKYEADMVVLDEAGVGVAVVEVKLGAANPVMTLCSDAGALLRLVDGAAGRTLTAITRAPLEGGGGGAAAAPGPALAAAAAAAAAAGGGAGSALAKARAASAAAPFAAPAAPGRAWTTWHVPVHPQCLPVYVLGKGIGPAELAKGAASLVDSCALKLMARSPADAAACLAPAVAAAAAAGAGAPPVSSRVPLALGPEQRALIMEQLCARVETLQRCLIFSLAATDGGAAHEAGAGVAPAA